MNWLTNNWPTVLELAGSHLVQSVIPVLVGLLISVPLARLAAGNRWLRPVFVTGSSLLYTIPSLTLFVVLPLIIPIAIPLVDAGGLSAIAIVAANAELSAAIQRSSALEKLHRLAREAGAVGTDRAVDAALKREGR